MIQVESITIEEFRGIRKLTLEPKSKNYAVCGPNGTGKSGIVDAIEFALTGNVSRLSGKGTGDVSIKSHGPHVDSRNRPDKARVRLTVSIPSIKKKAVIDRTVKNSSKPTITPCDPEIIKVLNQVAVHPEFVLSRRELIRYVISPPGDRAREVQALLRLDQVEDLRATLTKMKNVCERQIEPLKREQIHAQEQLLRASEITQLTAEKLLEAANSRRKILRLAPIEVLSSATSLKDGLVTDAVSVKTSTIPKAQAISDIKSLREAISQIIDSTGQQAHVDLIGELTVLNNDPAVVDSVTRDSFLRTAIQLISEDSCPVCDTRWNRDELKKLINRKLEHFDDIAKTRKKIENKLTNYKQFLLELQQALNNVLRHGKLVTPVIDVRAFEDFISLTSSRMEQVESFLPLDSTISVLNDLAIVPSEIIETIIKIEKFVVAIPEPTEQDAARDYLVLCQERLETYRGIKRRVKSATEQAQLMRTICDTYGRVSTSVLDGIYKKVQGRFGDLYKSANSEDEGDFEARLIPSFGKLGFDVDFYGRGFFPPGAYHSEGHQDSMGLCLYLTLMEHLLHKSFSFAVLDDVLMSVDSGHRREVCNLLKNKFPDTQFILTTHDPIWFKQMKAAGLIGSNASIHFKNWDVTIGPTEWDDRDVWREIDDYLTDNKVREAASLLRHYLEFIALEICHRLRASVEFRADALYTLGDLLPKGTKRFDDLLLKGIKAAQSWGKTEEVKALTERRKDFKDIVAESNVEQWQINPSVHYNEWANLDKNDFSPVVTAYRKLTGFFFCPDCEGLFYVISNNGKYESLKCVCGSGINLKFKN